MPDKPTIPAPKTSQTVKVQPSGRQYGRLEQGEGIQRQDQPRAYDRMRGQATVQRQQGTGQEKMYKFETAQEAMQAAGQMVKPMGIPAFMLLMTFAIILDVVDFIQITGVGEIIVIIVNLVAGAIFSLLLWYCGQKTQVMMIIGLLDFFVELIPAIELVPFNVIAIILAFILSQEKVQEKFQETTQKVAQYSQIAEDIGKTVQKVQSSKLVRFAEKTVTRG